MHEFNEKVKGLEGSSLDDKIFGLKKLQAELKKDLVINTSASIRKQLEECDRQLKNYELAKKNKSSLMGGN
jgi:hypothetical protein